MKASVQVTITPSDEESYTANLEIPTATPSKDAPFVFKVTQSGTSEGVTDDVLVVAIGDKDHFYVGVKPPKSLMQLANVDSIVNQLQVVVEEGAYNVNNGTFS
jgi:hypothetical protein